ncbi:hypothetical protein JOD03_002740 [Chryseomicrobium aureum]|uniref:YjcQ family protein n=1 Tax=Chryseomicrobium aureum TaxID=1441723 RepID=UPI00195A3F45|nr:YjcQ family protein [Chryseomicrobium aureum]MBM7707793.1 hypothetical protein [Chryseomicrobium aureum]
MKKDKLRYAILKEFESGNKSFNQDNLGLSKDEFDEQIRFLHREKYIDGVMYADDQVYTLQTIVVTEKGEQYISENSTWAKVYRGLKEIKDFIK